MARKPAVDRALRAQRTKKRLFQSAAKLIDKHGYDKVSIADISRKAGVSVGAFYHYYNSKTDIIVEFFKRIDVYFEEYVETRMTGNPETDLDIFFRHYAQYHIDQGVDHTSMIMKIQSTFFLDKTRYMPTRLRTLLRSAKETGLIAEKYDVDLIADYMVTLARGVLYDWVLAQGKYDVIEKMKEYIILAKQSFR